MLRCEALDWMKAAGISVIVYGHVADATTLKWTPPIYAKQLGVACFLFAAGFALARDRRPTLDAMVSRLLPVYIFGVGAALLMTTIGVVFGPTPAPSNFLPFMAGANVVFDNFPANPTTWYLGTYIHALLLWAVAFAGRRVGLTVLAVALAIEIGARVALQEVAGSYVAYMLLTNWLGPFIAGMFMGARPTTDRAGFAPGYVLALAVILVTISLSMGAMQPAKGFPFMTPSGGSLAGLFGFSVVISTLYLATSFLMFKGFERAPAPAAIRYLARNSLIIVLLHMPLYFALNPVLIRNGWSYTARVVLELILCLPVLAWLSEVITNAVSPKAMASRLSGFIPSRARTAITG